MLYDLRTLGGVGLDQLKLIGRQFAGFEDDAVLERLLVMYPDEEA